MNGRIKSGQCCCVRLNVQHKRKKKVSRYIDISSSSASFPPSDIPGVLGLLLPRFNRLTESNQERKISPLYCNRSNMGALPHSYGGRYVELNNFRDLQTKT